MERHVATAIEIAHWLGEQPGVTAVRHPALPESPYRPLVERYLPRGAGAVFSFDLESGREGGRRFIEALSLWSHVANVGDTKSLVIHPASTTHRQLSDDELAASGVAPGTVRLSVGLEDIEDLVWDLERALGAARPVTATA
jgi:O-acetylhomoserine (thiol)-lyase